MKKRIGYTFVLLIVIALVLLLSLEASAKTINADTTFREALDQAANGDTIVATKDFYNEAVYVDRSVTIISNKNTTVQAPGTKTFYVWANNVTIRGFTLTGSNTAIWLAGAQNCSILNNNIGNCSTGIYSSNVNSGVVRGNTIYHNTNGIYFSGSAMTVDANVVNYNTYGININESQNNFITGNIMDGNTYGIYIQNYGPNQIINNTVNNSGAGIVLDRGSQCKIANNTVLYSYTTGIRLLYARNNEISANTVGYGRASENDNYGIEVLRDSNFNKISGNTVNNHTIGILVYVAAYNEIFNQNQFISNRHGIRIAGHDNVISNNLCSQNMLSGINFINNWAYNNKIIGNQITKNGNGIIIESGSYQNIFTGNILSHNSLSGIFCNNSAANQFDGNTIEANQYHGIHLAYAGDNLIVKNIIKANGQCGLLADTTNNNTIYNNKFIYNARNAVDNGINNWNIAKTPGANIIGGPNLGGNSWTDYQGKDTDGDGLGNTLVPYSSDDIKHGGDNHPLVRVEINSPPNTPSFVAPANGSIVNRSSVTLQWNGGDPDPGDRVKYEIYLSTAVPLVSVASGQTDTVYQADNLPNGKYYYKIVACDGIDSVESLIWSFTVAAPQNLALHKLACQSTSQFGKSGMEAVDGNPSGDFSTGSVTHTDWENQPWWQVDLAGTCRIDQVKIYNRTEAAPERLTNFDILISNDGVAWKPFHFPDQAGSPTIIDTGGIIGRFVRVQLSGSDFLSLAEVEVYGENIPDSNLNLALGKPTNQSSNKFGTTGAEAVDGNPSGDFSTGSVTHTDWENQPWWQMDLVGNCRIDQVKIYNRTDATPELLTNFNVLISGDGVAWQTFYFPGQAGSPTLIDTGGVIGRFVRVQLVGTGFLSLAEVEVYGERLPEVNLALGKPAMQSCSQFGTTGAEAVDGNTNGKFGDGSVTHTDYQAQPWWQVDLENLNRINRINIYNRTDAAAGRLSNFNIEISPDGTQWQTIPFPGRAGNLTIISTGVITGRFIRIQLAGSDYLSLAEVEVIGEPLSITMAEMNGTY